MSTRLPGVRRLAAPGDRTFCRYQNLTRSSSQTFPPDRIETGEPASENREDCAKAWGRGLSAAP